MPWHLEECSDWLSTPQNFRSYAHCSTIYNCALRFVQLLQKCCSQPLRTDFLQVSPNSLHSSKKRIISQLNSPYKDYSFPSNSAVDYSQGVTPSTILDWKIGNQAFQFDYSLNPENSDQLSPQTNQR